MARINWRQIKFHLASFLALASIFANVKTSSAGEVDSVQCEQDSCSLVIKTDHYEGYLNEQENFWISISNAETEEESDDSCSMYASRVVEQSSEDRKSNSDCPSISVFLSEDEEWDVTSTYADLPIRKRKKPFPTSAKTSTGQTCPNETHNWIDFGQDTCYLFENEEQVSWYEASLRCIQKGGALANIQSPDELNALSQLLESSKNLPNLIHLGLHRTIDGAADDEFIWFDKTPFNSNNWNEGDPGGVDENCAGVIASSLKFSSYNCQTQTASYICSIRKDGFKGESSIDALKECSSDVPYLILIGIGICVFCIGALLGYAVSRYFKTYRRRRLAEKRGSARTTYNEYNYPKMKPEPEPETHALEEPIYNYPRMKRHRSTSVHMLEDQETYEVME